LTVIVAGAENLAAPEAFRTRARKEYVPGTVAVNGTEELVTPVLQRCQVVEPGFRFWTSKENPEGSGETAESVTVYVVAVVPPKGLAMTGTPTTPDIPTPPFAP
jgi:hypothetical protein